MANDKKHGIADKFRLPKSEPSMRLLASSPHIELIDNIEAVVEGFKCILEYDDTHIRLNMGKKSLSFTGANLVIKTMHPEQLIISGDIISVEFSS